MLFLDIARGAMLGKGVKFEAFSKIVGQRTSIEETP